MPVPSGFLILVETNLRSDMQCPFLFSIWKMAKKGSSELLPCTVLNLVFALCSSSTATVINVRIMLSNVIAADGFDGMSCD